jgi:flagellar hook protein FlgE
MTISSSLNAGVAGLNVNASRLATISDNIANSGTYGYKRAVADFSSMVIDQTRGSYSAGGVRVTTFRMVDEQGTLVNSDNPTDLAIAGRGMLPVTTLSAVDSSSGTFPLRLTTTGSFRPDSSGILRTDTGLVLMGWPARPNGTIPDFPRTTSEGLEPVRVNLNQFAGDPTTLVNLALNLPATATQVGESGDTIDFPVEYFDNLGTSQNINLEMTPTVPASGAASNEWNIVIRDAAQAGALVGDYTVTFDSSQAGGGAIASVQDNSLLPVVGTGDYDPATGEIEISVSGGGTMRLDIGRYNDTNGMTQLSDVFAPVSVNRNGSPVGNLSSVEVDANGFLQAIYDIGFTKTIYQIPVADVPNMNGLISQNNQTFEVSPASGSLFLWNAGEGPTGDMAGFTREESATDVAAELTSLIQTQRAYSSNAKVIQTVDEMLQETTNIKR